MRRAHLFAGEKKHFACGRLQLISVGY